jgi:hypothetical protein
MKTAIKDLNTLHSKEFSLSCHFPAGTVAAVRNGQCLLHTIIMIYYCHVISRHQRLWLAQACHGVPLNEGDRRSWGYRGEVIAGVLVRLHSS